MEDNNNERLKINFSEIIEQKDCYYKYFIKIDINCYSFYSPDFAEKEEILNYKYILINNLIKDYDLIKILYHKLVDFGDSYLICKYFGNLHIEDANKYIYDYFEEEQNNKIFSEEVIDYLSKLEGVDNSNSKGESIFLDDNEKDSEFNLHSPFGTEEDKQKLKEYIKDIKEDIIQRAVGYDEKGNMLFIEHTLKDFQELNKKVKKLSEKNKKLKAKNKKLTKQLRKLTATINTGE